METPEQADAIIAARAARSARAAGPKFGPGDAVRYVSQASKDKLIADVAQDEKDQAADRMKKPGWGERMMLYNRIYGKMPYEIATGDDDKVAASLESSDDDDGSGSKKKPVVLESSDDDDFGGFRRKGTAKRVPRKHGEKRIRLGESREPRGEKRSRLGGFEFDSGSWPGPRKPASVKPGPVAPRGAKRGSGRGPSRLDDFEFL